MACSRKSQQPDADEKPHPGLLTIEQMCAIFRVTDKAIRDWVGAGMPVEVQGEQGRGRRTLFKLEDCTRWYFEENFERLELDRERAALAREQRDAVAIKNAKDRGELVSVPDLAKQFGDAIAVCRSLLLAIPTKEAQALAPLSDANAIESRLRKAVYEALQQLAEFGSRVAQRPGSRDQAGDAGMGAAAKPNGKRVGGRAPHPQ